MHGDQVVARKADNVTKSVGRLGDEVDDTTASTRAQSAANDEYSRSTDKARKETDGFTNRVQSLKSQLGDLRGLLASVGVVFFAREALQTADAMAALDIRLTSATRLTGDYVFVQRELFRVTQENAAAYATTIKLFQDLARAGPELEATNDQVILLTDTVQKLGVIGGSTNEQMNNGLLQFTQGLTAGVFRAEELNSILENLPEVASRIARGMDMTVGELRAAVLAGEVLSKDVFDSLLSQATEIAAEYGEIPITVARGSQQLRSSISAVISDLDQMNGTTMAIGQTLSDLSAALDSGDAAETLDDMVTIGEALAVVLAVRLTAGYRQALASQVQYQTALMSGKAVALESAQADVMRAEAAMHLASADLRKARSVEVAAVAQRQAATSSATLEVADRKLAAAKLATAEATRAATAAQVTLTAAQHRATLGSRVLTTALTGLKGAYALLGGPVGVAALAAWGIYEYSSATQEAKESTAALIEDLDQLTGLYVAMGEATTEHRLGELRQELETTQALLDQLERPTSDAGRVNSGALGIRSDEVEALQEYNAESVRLKSVITELERKIAASEKALTALRSEQDDTGESAKKLTTQQQDLLDTLFPLQELGREYAADLVLLDEIYGENGRSTTAYQQALDALKREYIDLFPALKSQLEEEKKRTKAIQQSAAADQKLVDTLRDEASLLNQTGRERAIEVQLRKLSANATEEQREAVARLAGVLYDEEQARERAEEAAERYAEVWDNSMRRMDDSMAQWFRAGLDGSGAFWDQMVDTAKDGLAELAWVLTREQIMVNIGFGVSGGMGGLSGLVSGAGSAGSTGGLLGGGLTLAGLMSGPNALLGSAFTGAEALAANLGLSNVAGGLYDWSSRLAATGGRFGIAGGAAVNLGAGLAGGFAGNLLADSLFSREQATGGVLGVLGGLGGSYFGPLGAAAGAAVGNLFDTAIGGSDFSGKRVKFGVTAGGRQEGGFDFSETAASGLELGLITRRTDNVGLSNENERALLDSFLAIDSTLTELSRAFGVNVDLSGQSLTNPTGRRYDGGQAPADFFGSLGKGGTSQEELEAAPAEFIQAWIAATSDVFDEGVREALLAIDGTAEEMLAEFGEILAFEEAKAGFKELFTVETESERLMNQFQALRDEFKALTGETLPNTRAGMQEYINAIDVHDEANKEVIQSILAMAPALEEIYSTQDEWVQILTDAVAQQAQELEQLMAGVQADLEALTLSSFERELLSIERALEETIAAATERRATEEDLADIYRLAGLQVNEVVRSIEAEIYSLTQQLYGGDIVSEISAEQERIADLNRSRDDAYRAELRRHEELIASNETITDFLESLVLGELSTLSPEQRLAEAQRQFDAAIAAGDAQDATQSLSALLTIARDYYSGTQGYRDIFSSGNAALQSLIADVGTAPTAPAAITGSPALSSLQAQLEQQQQEEERLRRQAMVADLIDAYRAYGAATDQSVIDLMLANGLNLDQVAADFGISLDGLESGQGEQLTQLAIALGTDSTILANILSGDLSDLQDISTEGTTHLRTIADELIPPLQFAFYGIVNEGRRHHGEMMARLQVIVTTLESQLNDTRAWRSQYDTVEWWKAHRQQLSLVALQNIDRDMDRSINVLGVIA